MIIVKNRFSGLVLAKGYAAMAIWPFVFIRPEITPEQLTPSLLNHERIHLRQQKEMLLVFFFMWYALEFLLGLVVFRDMNKAYRNISFEKEAYANEGNPVYLVTRKFWNWLKY